MMNNRIADKRGALGPAMTVLVLLFLLAAIPWTAASAAGRPASILRLLVADSLPPPYLMLADGRGEPVGLAIDLCRKVAARLGHASSVRVAPPKRVPELIRAGEADMLCHVSPGWYAYPDEMWFGRKLYSADNVFIASRDAGSVCNDCALPAEVATVIGYEYGDKVGRSFANGLSTRRDVRTEENVFRLVQHGRVAYGIVSEHTFHYFAHDQRGLAIKGYAARYDITVGVPRKGPITQAQLQAATAAIRLPQDVTPEFRPFLGPKNRP